MKAVWFALGMAKTPASPPGFFFAYSSSSLSGFSAKYAANGVPAI